MSSLFVYSVLWFENFYGMTPQIVDAPPTTIDMEDGREKRGMPVDQAPLDAEKKLDPPPLMDAFGDEEFAEVKYKTMKWWSVATPVRSTYGC